MFAALLAGIGWLMCWLGGYLFAAGAWLMWVAVWCGAWLDWAVRGFVVLALVWRWRKGGV